jgi:hypothetical protein
MYSVKIFTAEMEIINTNIIPNLANNADHVGDPILIKPVISFRNNGYAIANASCTNNDSKHSKNGFFKPARK